MLEIINNDIINVTSLTKIFLIKDLNVQQPSAFRK